MAVISQKEVDHVAQLARLELTEAERTTFAEQLSHILSYMDQLQGVPTEGLSRSASVADQNPVMREDRPRTGISAEAALANAPESHEGFFIVPKIIIGK